MSVKDSFLKPGYIPGEDFRVNEVIHSALIDEIAIQIRNIFLVIKIIMSLIDSCNSSEFTEYDKGILYDFGRRNRLLCRF